MTDTPTTPVTTTSLLSPDDWKTKLGSIAFIAVSLAILASYIFFPTHPEYITYLSMALKPVAGFTAFGYADKIKKLTDAVNSK